MRAALTRLGITLAATTALAIGGFLLPATTAAQADPYVGLDTAEAHALSLRNPYYTYFLYNPCDFSGCTILPNPQPTPAPRHRRKG